MSEWKLENLLHAATLGILLMIYADQRASRIKKHTVLVMGHLIIIYLLGLGLVVKLFLELIVTLR